MYMEILIGSGIGFVLCLVTVSVFSSSKSRIGFEPMKIAAQEGDWRGLANKAFLTQRKFTEQEKIIIDTSVKNALAKTRPPEIYNTIGVTPTRSPKNKEMSKTVRYNHMDSKSKVQFLKELKTHHLGEVNLFRSEPKPIKKRNPMRDTIVDEVPYGLWHFNDAARDQVVISSCKKPEGK